MFRRSYVQNVLYSEVPMFRRSYVQKIFVHRVLYSELTEGSISRRSDMFRRSYRLFKILCFMLQQTDIFQFQVGPSLNYNAR